MGKRRIIGGVIRAAAKPEASCRSSAPVFQVDIDDQEGLFDASAGGSHASKMPGSRSFARDSSLVRGYNALGKVQFHRMDSQDDILKPAATSLGRTTNSKRCLSVPSTKARSDAPSAMSLDLGLPSESCSPLASPPCLMTTSQSAADLCQKSATKTVVTKS